VRLTAVALLLAFAIAGCAATTRPAGDEAGSSAEREPASSPGPLRLRLARIAGNYVQPVHVASTPSQPNRIYVVEKAGRVRVVENGRLRSGSFLDIRSLVGSDASEQGLLSLAFHPDYATNRLFYVDYTDRNGDTRVVEYRSRTSGAPVKVRELLFVDQPFANHNGGQLAFGPDGRLYAGMGDGGGAGDPDDVAQDLGSLLGKLLRIDVDRARADWEIVGYGLRNPWRFAFDRKTGDLYIADVGQSEWEEIDFTPRSSPGLENYGWDAREGKHVYEGEEPNPTGKLVDPIHEYGHSKGCSVTGGFVYRGSRIPAADGRYFFGDFCTGYVWSLVVRDGKATSVKRHAFTVPALASFGEGPTGELYLVSLSGTVYRLARR
jgi:glucose/arabinose dehydrogenase